MIRDGRGFEIGSPTKTLGLVHILVDASQPRLDVFIPLKSIFDSKVRKKKLLQLWKEKKINFLIKHTNDYDAKCVCCTKCQIRFNNRYSTYMYIEIHVQQEIVMYTAAAEWE